MLYVLYFTICCYKQTEVIICVLFFFCCLGFYYNFFVSIFSLFRVNSTVLEHIFISQSSSSLYAS